MLIAALLMFTVEDTSTLSHGHSENAEGTGWGGADQMAGDALHHPSVALASVLVLVGRGHPSGCSRAGNKCKASLSHSRPRAGPANIFPQSLEKEG